MAGRADPATLGAGQARPALAPLPRIIVEPIVRRALEEDLGRAGDVTSAALIPPARVASAAIVARGCGTIAGLEAAGLAFHLTDPEIAYSPCTEDGARVQPGDKLAVVEGPALGILTGERVALNLLGRLSGVASLTRQFADLLEDLPAQITCTRKTTPGLRALEKHAVRAGGGSNHRFGLDDAILIKDNHIAVVGGIKPALALAKKAAGHMMKIEIEVDTLAQAAEAAEADADVILLDNMTTDQLREGVALIAGRAITEASGTVTLDTVRAIGETGVDFISSGALTHSAPCLDIGLDITL